jgi:MraZ protein
VGDKMLVGTYEHKIDTKGRVVLPAKLREEVGSSVVSTIGIDKCISIYPKAKWDDVLDKFQQLSFSKGKSRGLMRLILSSASELQIDVAGRVLIPNFLREHAEIDQDICLIGVNDHIELWDKSNWNNYRNSVMEVLPDIAEEVEGF